MSPNLLLLQSIQGHLQLLAEKFPKKANSPVARRARKVVRAALEQGEKRQRPTPCAQ